VPGANPDGAIEDLGVYKNISKRLKPLWTLLTTREVVYEGGRTIRPRYGGPTPLQLADPPLLRMLARKRGPVHTQFGPILATIRERPPKNTRRYSEIVVS